MIDSLHKLVPGIESEIDRHYYDCFGEDGDEVSESQGVVVYIVRGERVGEYLHSAYGQQVEVPVDVGEVRLSKVDIFGVPWTSKFGYPPLNFSGSGQSSGNEFHCLNPSAAEKGYVRITSVDAGNIYGRTQKGKELKFRLGACSRLESSEQLPKIGQRLYWSGVPERESVYNLYSGTCLNYLS